MHDHLRNAPIGVIQTTANGEVLAANGRATGLLDTERESLVGSPITEAFPRSAAGTLHDVFAEGPPAEQSFEEYFPTVARWFEVDLVTSDDAVVVYVRDRSDRQEDRQRIDRLQRRLDRLETIDSLVPAVLERVVTASGRDEVSRELCERLGATELYEFAWVGERRVTDDGLEVVATAGEAPEMLDELQAHLGAGAALPERSAVERAETRVVQQLADSEDIPDDVRLAAFGRGLQSCIAVPLLYGDTVYGVLGVYSTHRDGFSQQERRGLETLGDIAGFAVKTIRQEDLLFAETVTELELSVRDEDIPLLAASRRASGRLTVDGAVPQEDDSVLCYLRVGGDAGDAQTVLSADENVETVRVVDDGDDGAVLQARVADGSLIPLLTESGGTVTAATYDGERAQVTVEFPADVELRRVLDAVDRRFAETDLESKSERSREPETGRSFESELDDRITEKQRQVLETAYFAEYFSSPRGSTSAEVGDALDISGPTVLYHLRRAQQKLLSSYFESDGPGEKETSPGE